MSQPCESVDHRAGVRGAEPDERPSSARVESFLDDVEEQRKSVFRTRLIGLGVVVTVAGVALLTALGAVPVSAENVVVSASAVVAGLAFGRN
jgi:hypothetical protein